MSSLIEEIAQQPAVLSGLRKFYTSPGAIPTKALRGMVKRWPPTVVFTGMGSSMYAAYPAQAYLNSLGIRALVWETGELVDHLRKFHGTDILLVVVSQSGETAEVLRLLDTLPRNEGLVAVSNFETSSLARHAKLLLPMMAGRPSPVGTKTYSCAVAVLMYLALAIARKPLHPLTQALMQAIEAQEKILDRQNVLIPATVEFFNHPHYTVLLSRGAELATVYQGALLFKEVAKMGAEPMSAAQFRHGPMEIIDPAHRYIIFARQKEIAPQRQTDTALFKLAKDIGKHGGRVLLYTDRPSADLANVRDVSVEAVRLGLGTLIDTVHIQLLVHEIALRAGLEPGSFRFAD
ncbi:MAG TPA: SIS domain-containing protein [Terriglobia bacterium]|nr:SIS domain-containing protein [Terriglobia bacterium]